MRIQRGLVMLLLIGIASLLSSNALAYHMAPANTTFVAQGPFNVAVAGVNIPCNAVFIVVTDAAGQPAITDAKFEGQILCSTIKPIQLPWKIEISSMTTGIIHNVGLMTPPATCTGNLPVIFSLSNTFTIPNTAMIGGCTVGGTLTVSPPYVIVP
ncbi:hypothetical protein [Dyella sp.]|uniref:hypothetical protein n=1 Tax=Dyella sp. TaxID=1869338 RepID=UPI002ED25357